MKPPSKVDGYFLGDILQDWVRSHGTGKPCVILYDINVELKRPAFWLKIPKDRIKELTKEVVVLNCDSNQEMMDITISIDPLFATALGFSEDGQLIFSNQERTI